MELNREHYKAYVYIELQCGKSATDIITQLKVSGLSGVPGNSTVYLWLKDFNDGKTTLLDAPRSGRPCSSSTDANVNAIRDLIELDPKQSTRCIGEQISVDKETARHILRDKLNLRKLCSVWVPHALSEKNKRDRVECATALVELFEQYSIDDLMNRFAVEDETWILFDSQLSKQENKAWISPAAKRPRVVRSVMTNKKTMVLLAFTGDGKIAVAGKAPGDTINSAAYVDFVHSVGDKWRTLRTKPMRLSELIWMHDNARPHSAASTVDFFRRRGVQMIKQSPYSPDLNLCDRWVFKRMKKHLRASSYNSEHEVITAALQWFRALPHDLFKMELNSLLKHCFRVIRCNGDYVI